VSEDKATPSEQPVFVHDGVEGWVIYPEDSAYRLVADMPKDEEGIVHVEPDLIAKVKGWWWDKALTKIDEFIEALGIPWEELELTDEQIREAEASELAEKLAKISHHMVRVSRELARVGTKATLAKSALEHVVSKLLAREDDKGPIGPRSSRIISKDKRLRNAKIESMEADAYRQALDRIYSALELLWKTTSRVLSTRMREPID